MTEPIQIQRKAYAKINLGLDVIRRCPDGYHEVKMIMQTVGICDILTFQKNRKPGIFIFVKNKKLPTDKNNLIFKAAEAVMNLYDIKEGVSVTLEKNIPIAAGMAGGSTDAAATFHGLKELFGLELSEEKMKELGVKIGADIPYCIMGKTALSEGIGEILTPLPAPPEGYLVIAKPDIYVSTKFVYENLYADKLQYHPDIDGMIEALKAGSLLGIAERMGNVLETVTVKEYPIIQKIKEEMCKLGAENALMSGSGPTVFGIWREKECADAAFLSIQSSGLAKEVFMTEFL